VYQPFLLEITGSVFITGILVTLGGIFMFLPNPWVGKLSDKFNRKKVWLLSIPFFYIGMTFLFFAENLILLIPGIIFFYLNQVIGSISFYMHISANSIKTKKGLLLV